MNFDVDTPTDVLIMSVHPALGEHTRAAVQNLTWDLSRAEAIKELLGNPSAELIIYGSVGSSLFQYLDANTRCRLRLYSEERSMKALGRDARGEVKALMGRLVEELGFTAFFSFLAELAGGAVLDTRVLFEHFHWQLSAADRFASDLGEVDLITHDALREFTRASLEAPIPILLGAIRWSLAVCGPWWMRASRGCRGQLAGAAGRSTINLGGRDVLERLKNWLDPTERELKRLRSVVDAINALEPEMQALSDEELRAKTPYFQGKLAAGASLDDLLVEAFAVVREASRRTLGMRHFDVQLLGGIILHQGRIAEMKTGEGKTLVATLPVYSERAHQPRGARGHGQRLPGQARR